MIIVDKREKNSMVFAELLERKHEVRLERLVVADYIIGNTAVERKTLPDFVSSMLNKRLLRQLEELKQYPKALLIIEGIDDHPLYEFGKVNPNAIRGMMLSITLNYNIPIILTKDSVDTAEFLILLEKRQEKGAEETSLKAKRRALNLAEQQQFLLEGFPGIGPATAKSLLKKFKTIKAIINADEKQLAKTKLNKNKIALIKKIINSRYIP